MITQEHQELLRKAVATNEKETVCSAFQKVLKEEFGAIRGLNQVAQDYLGDLAKLIVIPSKTEVEISQDVTPKEEQPVSNGLLHFMFSLIALVGVSVVGAIVGLVWGICLAIIVSVLAFFMAKKCAKKKVQNVVGQPKDSVREFYNEDTLMELANGIVKAMKGLADELVDMRPVGGAAIKLPLHECYLNVLKWLQMVYADALDFDEETRKYLLKRVGNIAEQCYYDVVEYDGKNENLFDKQEDYRLEENKMNAPAIIYSKTGKVILPGVMFVPSK